jgi:hypothetical protein
MISLTVHLRSGHWITREAIWRRIVDLQSKTSFIGAEFCYYVSRSLYGFLLFSFIFWPFQNLFPV